MVALALSGLISGLNTDSIVSSLVELQRGPINLLEQKQAVQSTKLSALQTLNARMLSLSVSVRSLSQSVLFQTKQGFSSNSSVVTVSASESADPGTHTVEVFALATAQSIAGGTFDSNNEALGFEGQFLIDGELINIDTEDTLASIAATLNNQVNTIRASVVEVNSNEYRLVINRRTAGADSVEFFEAGSGTLLQDLGLVTASTSVAEPCHKRRTKRTLFPRYDSGWLLDGAEFTRTLWNDYIR